MSGLNIKRILLLLLISLCLKTWSFSQTTLTITKDSLILITPEQLKTANLIFIEHSKLQLENNLLNAQVKDTYKLYEDELIINSTYENAITELKSTLNSTIQNKNCEINKYKKRTKIWRVIAISSTVLFLCLL